MRILSLFDGISCGRVACERAGFNIEAYYASEIDQNAIKIAHAMYPDTKHIGNVCEINFSHYVGRVDLILGGSPCQDLSIAKQNRQGLHGERSRLFWEYIKALSIIKPKYFLLENVASMKIEDRDAITAVLRSIYPETECIMINSALLSAQQRKRYYWTNWHVEQPKDKGLLVKDVLETPIADWEKAQEYVFAPIRIGQIGNGGQGERIYSVHGKSIALPASHGGGAKGGFYKIAQSNGEYAVRKLSPREFARLQTYPERCFSLVNLCNGHWYKAFGNGWTVDVIAHILSAIPKAK